MLLEPDRIREQSYAIDRQECDLGIQCVAAPVRAADGRLVAGISNRGENTEITEEAYAQLAIKGMRVALDISRKLISAGGSI